MKVGAKIVLRLTGILSVTVLLLVIIFTIGVGIWMANLGMNLLSLGLIIAGIIFLIIAIYLWYSYLENEKHEFIKMKDIIKKWLGIDAHSEILTRLLEEKEKAQAKVEQEKIREAETKEWDKLKAEIEEASKTAGGLVQLMTTSIYRDRIKRFTELSAKLWHDQGSPTK